jgi:hypothetical protein
VKSLRCEQQLLISTDRTRSKAMRVTQASAHRLGELIIQEFKFLEQKKI